MNKYKIQKTIGEENIIYYQIVDNTSKDPIVEEYYCEAEAEAALKVWNNEDGSNYCVSETQVELNQGN